MEDIEATGHQDFNSTYPAPGLDDLLHDLRSLRTAPTDCTQGLFYSPPDRSSTAPKYLTDTAAGLYSTSSSSSAWPNDLQYNPHLHPATATSLGWELFYNPPGQPSPPG